MQLNQTIAGESAPAALLMRSSKKPKVWVKKKHLCQAATRLTDEYARQLKRRGNWQWIGDLINVNSISYTERIRLGIPDNERLLEMVAAYKQQDEIEKMNGYTCNAVREEVDEIFYEMERAKLNYHNHFKHIKEKYNVSNENCKTFAQLWAVWQWILDNYARYKNRLTIFYSAYTLIFPGHRKSRNSFSNFMNACVKKGIEVNVIDHREIVKVAKRITSFQFVFLRSLYIQPQKHTAAYAAKKLAEACEGIGEKPYSLSSVKLYFKDFEHDPELFAARYGAAAAQKQLPYASLLPAEHRNTQWQMDGWTLPFWGEKFQRYVLYIIRDNHSRKIVGYSIGESENTAIILTALEDAMRNTGVFPGEIVSDKHSFHQTELAQRLRTETERMGAIWTVTTNAQRNQLAERYNQYLDGFCKEFTGYLGKNVTATGKDAIPSQEARSEMAKPGNWKTAEEIKAIAVAIILQFNKTSLEALEGKSPNEAYDASEDRKCFAISEAERVKLLSPANNYKVTRGQINIKVGVKKHEFQLPAELISRYNNRLLTVAVGDLEQGIYVSDPKSGEELGFIPPKKRIPGAIPDQSPEHVKILQQLKGRTNGVTTKARKNAMEKTTEALKENPEAIELINSYLLPKDIRAMAVQDKELKRELAVQGVNTNLLPIRDLSKQVATISRPESSKTKESPFNEPGAGDMSIITINDDL